MSLGYLFAYTIYQCSLTVLPVSSTRSLPRSLDWTTVPAPGCSCTSEDSRSEYRAHSITPMTLILILPSATIWNPDVKKGQSMADMEDGGWVSGDKNVSGDNADAGL